MAIHGSLLVGVPSIVLALLGSVLGHPYDPALAAYNLNTNQSAAAGDILGYSGAWSDKVQHGYTPSPDNWRALPTYTVLLDKFADGDPTNNDFFGTEYEWDLSANQLRHGGDIRGFATPRVLDYIQGMGYKCIYFGGTLFVNMPWQADGYSALDFTLLDPHYGTLQEWRNAIDEIHSRGMKVMFDMTTTTMGDLIGAPQYFNTSTPFDINGYKVDWKRPNYAPWGIDEYTDFRFDNTFNDSCQFPQFYDRDATPIRDIGRSSGCYAGDFDQFGDTEAFGVHPDYQRQMSKFASVQDRLRDWDPRVATKLKHLSCLVIHALDPDAFRIDKALQQTLGFVADWAPAVRQCAAQVGKNNFYIPGEITGGNTFGTLYIGRGRLPENYLDLGYQQAALVTANESQYFMRPEGANGLDAAAFHYSVYRSLTRFLGMDGNLEVPYDVPRNWAQMWNVIFTSNDFLNAATGRVDPRHLWGTTNQDVFRWPSLINGTERLLLGQLVTNVLMPGIPLMYYGEEQDMYVMDSTASNYIYGRQSMTASMAWQAHGCYKLGSVQYYDMPLGRGLTGCTDDWNSVDHFDPTSQVRALTTQFTYLRSQYAALQDGFNLVQIGNWTTFGTLPGSRDTESEWGMWSVLRGTLPNVTLSGPHSDISVWVLYSNLNRTETFEYDCSSELWISAPYPAPVTVKNLVAPYESYTLAESMSPYYADGKAPYRACLPSVTLAPWSFKILVPQDYWVPPLPQLVAFTPGHDARIPSDGTPARIPVSLGFTTEMDCDAVTAALTLSWSAAPEDTATPSLDVSSITCQSVSTPASNLTGIPGPVWEWTSAILNAPDGIMELVLGSVPAVPIAVGVNQTSTVLYTNATNHLLIRKGRLENPLIFPRAIYDRNLLTTASPDRVLLNNKAAGADMFRLSFDYGQHWQPWRPYSTSVNLLQADFSSAKARDAHIRVQYWSSRGGSAAQSVDGDLIDHGDVARRFPGFQLRGDYNAWRLMTSWPSYFQASPFGMRKSLFFGDVDGDQMLDLLPPNSQSPNYLNLSRPPSGYLGWNIIINQETLTWSHDPVGRNWISIAVFILLAVIPPLFAVLICWQFLKRHYGIFYNEFGFEVVKTSTLPPLAPGSQLRPKSADANELSAIGSSDKSSLKWPYDITKRRKVLIATLESEIFDWKIRVKIGGLGVMSTLMAKTTKDVDLIWVVPKVGDVTYPEANPEPPIAVSVYGETYVVDLQSHVLDNVRYLLLDSPVFRANTASDPYDDSMSNLRSAIHYSVWNQSIAEIIRRTPDLDLYHINDYHGGLAPLYLLPRIVPCSLSLHNAEFQGAWPLRTKDEIADICSVFNLSPAVVKKYAQFGNVLNLLHAAASFIAVHQDSAGVAGVSDMYGKRSWKRYPALWTLKAIDSLPNPDPTDLAPLDAKPLETRNIAINEEAEAKRPEEQRKAQEWAGLKQDSEAELFVFVGRWSLQKGVDLIADVFPRLLESNSRIQLIAVGPVVDLYGRLAAVKLARLMELYPERVFSKPEFTALPSCLFNGATWALIPSRDEPFGLVAVEFGRKGALGVGSRLGGLGLMPGFWYPVESDSTAHLHSQFTQTIKKALKLTKQERAVLRARSAVQRFPVLEWRQRLEDMHARSIRASDKLAGGMAWRSGQLVENVSSARDPTTFPPPSYGQAALDRTQASLSDTSKVSPFRRLTRFPLRGWRGAQTAPSDPSDLTSDFANSSLKEMQEVRRLPSGAQAPGFAPVVDELELESGLLHDEEAVVDDVLADGSRLADPEQTPQTHDHPIRSASETKGSETDSVDAKSLSDSFRSTMLPAGAMIPTLGHGHGGEIADFDLSASPRGSLDSLGSSASGWNSAVDLNTGSAAARSSSSLASTSSARNHDLGEEDEVEIVNKPRADALRLLTDRLVALYDYVPDPFDDLGLTEADFRLLSDDEALNSGREIDGISSVILQHAHSPINNVRPEFNDQDGAAAIVFSDKLKDLSIANSEGSLCIATFLVKTEKEYFEQLRKKDLSPPRQDAPPRYPSATLQSRPRSVYSHARRSRAAVKSRSQVTIVDCKEDSDSGNEDGTDDDDEASTNSQTPRAGSLTRWQIFLQLKVYNWPLYCVCLALGQCLSATSFQLALIGGTSSQSNFDLQVIAGVNIFASLVWYILWRTSPSVWSLSLPWLFFGAAFFLIGVPSLADNLTAYGPRHAITLVAECCYSFGSAAGFLFFSVNFGEEAGAPTSVWVMRACIVQGVQQLWVSGLWYFAFRLQGADPAAATSLLPAWSNGITMSLGTLCFGLGFVLFKGLPPYYRHLPGSVPNFFTGLFRRRLVVWWMVAEILRDFWLSPVYGRNQAFLWASTRAPVWTTFIEIFVFFVVIWAVVMFGLRKLVVEHTWLVPMVAIGLVSPRWAQSFWGISGLGSYIPWAGSAGHYVSTGLWLWLGMLDAVQGVGLGLMLLQTLSRVHVLSTLFVSQVIGAATVIVAREVVTPYIRPSSLFPNFGLSWHGFASWAFYIALVSQVVIVVGFMVTFRKEQLSKP